MNKGRSGRSVAKELDQGISAFKQANDESILDQTEEEEEKGSGEEEEGDKEGDDKSVEDLTRGFSLTSEQLRRDSLCKVSKLINALAKKGGVKVSKLTEVVVPRTTLDILRRMQAMDRAQARACASRASLSSLPHSSSHRTQLTWSLDSPHDNNRVYFVGAAQQQLSLCQIM
ncbi:hypothetical protein Tco_0433302 [Tanacetum coccineum]